MRILLIEEDVYTREVLFGLLEKPAATIHCVDACEAADFFLARHPYDWLVLGVSLHTKKAQNLLNLIHAQYPTTKILFIIDTTGTVSEFALASITVRFGKDAILPKPIYCTKLIATIHGRIR